MSQWITTALGRDHFLTGHESTMNTVDVYEIAHSLAQINRFTGHASRPYSVAEHCLLTQELAALDRQSALVQLLCLCHDWHEAFTGDAASPIKHTVGLAWATFEHRQADQVRRQLGLRTGYAAHRDTVRHYDHVALATERAALMRFDARRNRHWFIDEPASPVRADVRINLHALDRVNATWSDWKNLLLKRFFALQERCDDAAPAHHPV